MRVLFGRYQPDQRIADWTPDGLHLMPEAGPVAKSSVSCVHMPMTTDIGLSQGRVTLFRTKQWVKTRRLLHAARFALLTNLSLLPFTKFAPRAML